MGRDFTGQRVEFRTQLGEINTANVGHFDNLDRKLSRESIRSVDFSRYSWVHDPGLERLCQQEGMIWDYSASELKTFTAFEPSRFGSRFATSDGVGVCPLREVATLLTEHPQVNCFVELKAESLSQFDATTVYNAVATALSGVESRCVLISFELEALLYAKRQGWQRHAPVFDQWPDWQLASLWQLQPEVVFCDRTIVPGDIDLRTLPWPALIYEVSTANVPAPRCAKQAPFRSVGRDQELSDYLHVRPSP